MWIVTIEVYYANESNLVTDHLPWHDQFDFLVFGCWIYMLIVVLVVLDYVSLSRTYQFKFLLYLNKLN